jgi:hypothetical protein
VDPRADLDAVEKRKNPLPLLGIEPWSSSLVTILSELSQLKTDQHIESTSISNGEDYEIPPLHLHLERGQKKKKKETQNSMKNNRYKTGTETKHLFSK